MNERVIFERSENIKDQVMEACFKLLKEFAPIEPKHVILTGFVNGLSQILTLLVVEDYNLNDLKEYVNILSKAIVTNYQMYKWVGE